MISKVIQFNLQYLIKSGYKHFFFFFLTEVKEVHLKKVKGFYFLICHFAGGGVGWKVYLLVIEMSLFFMEGEVRNLVFFLGCPYFTGRVVGSIFACCFWGILSYLSSLCCFFFIFYAFSLLLCYQIL